MRLGHYWATGTERGLPGSALQWDAPARTRTWDLLLRRQPLYPAELQGLELDYGPAARWLRRNAAGTPRVNGLTPRRRPRWLRHR